MRRAPVVLAAFLTALGSAVAQPALAGTFDVSACDAAPGFVNNSWAPEATNPAMVTSSACPSGDNPRSGLRAGQRARSSRWTTVPAGAATRWRFDAPPQTTIVGIRANALFEQEDTRWQVGLSNRSRLLIGCRATRRTGGACIGAMSNADYYPLEPTDVLYAQVNCVYARCKLARGRRFGARASMTFARVTITDATTPNIADIGGTLWTADWIARTRHVTFNATDNTGIKEVRVSVDGGVKASAHRECDPTDTTCPQWPAASLTVATGSDVPDGRHTLSLQAVDRADNVGELTREILIDNTPPAAPQQVTVIGGDGWRSTPAFSIGWTNPTQDFAPITGVEYTLCPTPPSALPCQRASKDGDGIQTLADLQVPQPGDWLLTAWLRDAAGNAAPETAAAPVHVRFDPSPPQVAIRPSDPQDPSRVHFDAADDLSGIARVELELRRQGTEVWRQLDTAPDAGGGFSAPLHDERLRDGVYELRAHAWDGAGNERSSTQLSTGADALLTLPVRVKTRLLVGTTLKLHALGANRRGPRTRTVYIARPLIGFGHPVRLHGRLVAPGDNPVAGAVVDVAARADIPGAQFQPVATVTTSRTGRFAYLVPAGSSRVYRFDYAGAPKIRPQSREVEIRVRASSTIRRSPRSVVNGEAVTFAGQLLGGAIPAGGKLLELQWFDRGKWRTFRTFRASQASGRWRYAYRFDGTRGVRRYRMRVRVPREAGYPYATGASPFVGVTVRGL